MNVHVCVHICAGIYLHVMYVYMWINFDVRLMIVITVDIPSFLCHLISFTSLPPFLILCPCLVFGLLKIRFKRIKKNLLTG